MTNIADRLWFQILERCWRPLQQWGFAIVSVAYACRPLVEMSFNLETFAALAAASGVGFISRGIEKIASKAVSRNEGGSEQ